MRTFKQQVLTEYELHEIATEPLPEESVGILRQRVHDKSGKKEWVLLDRKGKRPLEWFGVTRPSDERVKKAEKRVQFFKHQG
jgi:hypothetical protein